ncbi:copper homeostasis protein cutC homolog isoform X4 [Pipistrellus kuhlii]|uniref:copper homeostasis protein cutC homolog isoform X4 n=1 Tax=Pipistrellus kuhlii TaxID=59472 RepID=UPI00174F4D11|nr:copper homeostasis protein cutC homolog isoform X4 [Pipistrellus kuhlii]
MKRQGSSSERTRMPSGKAGTANGFLMEVCVDSVESAVNAERGGAGRIELCSGLVEGGITPSMGLLQVVKQCVQIPVFVIIRPRGGDFLYSDHEVEVMKADIRLAKLYGADGLVFGALTEDGQIDKELCMSLMALCRPLPVTFHRGGGITDRNLQRILEGSGATEFHCSARSARDSGMKFRNSSVAMGTSLCTSEYSLKVTDVTQVRTLNAIAMNSLV